MMTPTQRLRQRGSAALATAMILLFATSIGVLFMNRSLIFEQKASANQVRSTTALEVAEAGLEWTIGMLNQPFDINPTDCSFLTTTQTSFRRRYLMPNWNTDPTVTPATQTYPGCTIDGTTLNCNCPNVTAGVETVASLSSTERPRFTVAFSRVPRSPTFTECIADVNNTDCPVAPDAVRVTVTGCTATTGTCRPGSTTGSSGPDAVAVVTAIVKLRPLLRSPPPAALTCGGNCNPGGSYNIINTDPSTNGITINAGGTITLGNGASVASLPGVPAANSQVGGDSSLSSIASTDPTCSNSNMFKAFFGSTIDEYRQSPNVKTIPNCSQANTCGGLVDAAYNDGWRHFYFPDGFARNNSSGSLGSATSPVTLVTPGSFDVNGNITIYGLIFSNSSSVNDLGTGTADIRGGIVACRNHSSNGNGTIAYDPDVMQRLSKDSAEALRVPGSWSDACRLSTGTPPALTCY